MICAENGGLEPPERLRLDPEAVAALEGFRPPLPSEGSDGSYDLQALMAWVRSVYAEIRNIEGQTSLYRHFDEEGQLLYVGIAFDLYARSRQHNKSRWARLVTRIDYEVFPTRAEALAAEKEAIRVENPVHNIRR